MRREDHCAKQLTVVMKELEHRGGTIGDRVVSFAHGVSAALAAVAGVAIIALILATVADVVKRKATGGALQGVIEGSSLVLPAIAFLGMAQAQRDGAHVATTLFTGLLPNRTAAVTRAIALFVTWIGLLWLWWATAQSALESFESREFQLGVMKLPVWPSKVAIWLGLTVLLIELAIVIGSLVQSARGRGDAVPAVLEGSST